MTPDFKAIVARADCEAYSEFHWAQATEDRRALIALCREGRELLGATTVNPNVWNNNDARMRRDAFLEATLELP